MPDVRRYGTHPQGRPVSIAAVLSLIGEMNVGYSDQATWGRQWYDLQAAYETIQRYCAGGSLIDNQEARRVVLTGCSAAWSLAEHVTNAKAGKSYRDNDADLKDARSKSASSALPRCQAAGSGEQSHVRCWCPSTRPGSTVTSPRFSTVTSRGCTRGGTTSSTSAPLRTTSTGPRRCRMPLSQFSGVRHVPAPSAVGRLGAAALRRWVRAAGGRASSSWSARSRGGRAGRDARRP